MNNWFETPLGESILKKEIAKCAQLVPSGYYARGLQVGFSQENYLENIEVTSRFIVDSEFSCEFSQEKLAGNLFAVSSVDALPFPEKSHDLVVLPHTLDFCENPHEVLRQANQILVPEGCMVIVGFNAVSFYGAIKVFLNRSKNTPWNGHFYGVGRVQDWLALLGYDLVGAGMMSYQPPLQSERWREKLKFVDNAGDRWWPGLGGVYVIVGRKREMAVTSLPKSPRSWRNIIPGMAQPASQRAAKIGLKLVPKN